jgi:DNA-binding NarL/FixJ family response regulator
MTMVGAVGYLEKQTATEILPSAIHEVFMGHRFYSTAIAKRMANLNIS